MINLKSIKWHVWVLPILAIIFSAFFIIKHFNQKGLEIEISFTEAKSIQPEKTRIFYRGVPVGKVTSISISEDGKKAICKVDLNKDATKFAVDGTEFYLVYPKVGFEGISGLETIISGSYIAIEPGKADANEKKNFEGKLSMDISGPEENMSTFVVETNHAESITTGDNIFYRGVVIGSVGDIKLSKTAQSVLVNINIKNYYTKIIRTNTAFWKKQGIKADLGLFKSDIRINSLDTILKGGIEVATPTEKGPKAKSFHKFPLLVDEPKDYMKWNPEL